MERFRDIALASLRPYLPRIMSIAAIAAIFLLSGCATEQVDLPVGNEVPVGKTTFSFSQKEGAYDLFPEYRIAPGDVLDVLFQIRTWVKKEEFKLAIDHTIKVQFVYAPELDSTQKVRPDGNITLPYLGDIYVVGKTVDELTEELKKRYKNILQIPELSVIVPEFRSSIKELKADLHTAPRGLSRLTTVRPDGYVTFPMVDDLFVAGKTLPEVGKMLNEMYDKLLPGLHCDLFLEKHSGSQIYIVGQIKKPGAYSISRPISILEALSLAESYMPGARLDSVVVVRRHGKELVATRVDLRDALTFGEGKKLFYLQPDDIVYVPRTWLSTGAEVARDLGNILFFRGWSFTFSHDIAIFD